MMDFASCREAEIAVQSAALANEAVSGDRHVARVREGWLQLAVVDGLGHGQAAYLAATAVVDVFDDSSLHPSQLDKLFRRAHQAARGTRGVAMSVVSVDLTGHRLIWSGVGNVEGALVRASLSAKVERILPRGGIVGYRLPELRIQELAIEPHDTIVLASDGLNRDVLDHSIWRKRHQLRVDEVLATLFATCRLHNDDALLLLARYISNGGTP